MNNFSQINKSEILDDIFDNTFVAILVVQRDRVIKLVNDSFCKLFGYEKEELIGKSAELFHVNKKYSEHFKNIAFDKIVQNQAVSIEYQFKKKDGSTFWVKISGNPARNESNFLWMIIDISETIKTRNQLSEQGKLLKTVINENPNPIVLKNYDAKFVLVNTATASLYNSTPEEMIGKDDGDFILDKKLSKFFRKNVQEIMDKGETQIVYEDSIDVKTNEIKNFMSIKKPFKNQYNQKFILVIANDITELNNINKELAYKEKLLFQQGKLVSMGEMIGNIAHQWRQPLSSISVLASGIKLEKDLNILKDENFNYAMNNILSTTQYLSQTIDDFRSFFDPKNSKITTFNITELVDKTLTLVTNQLKSKDINIKKDIDIFEISTFKNELLQVIVNIVSNSKDAFKEEGKNNFIQITIYKDSQFAYIEINDNAGGIPLEIIDKIFEPYFTTKHQSQGTGIGLFMSEEIVQKHLNGKITAINKQFEVDKIKYMGAMFTITLPLKL